MGLLDFANEFISNMEQQYLENTRNAIANYGGNPDFFWSCGEIEEAKKAILGMYAEGAETKNGYIVGDSGTIKLFTSHMQSIAELPALDTQFSSSIDEVLLYHGKMKYELEKIFDARAAVASDNPSTEPMKIDDAVLALQKMGVQPKS